MAIVLFVLIGTAIEIAAYSWGTMLALGILAAALGIPALALGFGTVAAAVTMFVLGKLPGSVLAGIVRELI